MKQELQQKLERVQALRKLRAAEQLRLAAELHAQERVMRQHAEARRTAERFLDGDLSQRGLLAGQGLRAAAEYARLEADAYERVTALGLRNTQMIEGADRLAELEWRLAGRLEQVEADSEMMETVALRPALSAGDREESDR